MTTETERLREMHLLFESELNRVTTGNTNTGRQTHNLNHTTQNIRNTWHTSLTYNFSRKSNTAAQTLQQLNPHPNIPRLLDAPYDAHEILRADPQWHTLPEMVMRFLGHLVGTSTHTGTY